MSLLFGGLPTDINAMALQSLARDDGVGDAGASCGQLAESTAQRLLVSRNTLAAQRCTPDIPVFLPRGAQCLLLLVRELAGGSLLARFCHGCWGRISNLLADAPAARHGPITEPQQQRCVLGLKRIQAATVRVPQAW